MLLNKKDLLTLNQNANQDIFRLAKRLNDPKFIDISNNLKPNITIYKDIWNFWPQNYLRIKHAIEKQIQLAQKLQNSFQTEYSFASKLISNMRFNYQVHQYCQRLFKDVSSTFLSINQQIVVDYVSLYQKWLEKIQDMPNTKKYLQNTEFDPKLIKNQIHIFFGQFKNEQAVKRLLLQAIEFQKQAQSICLLQKQAGQQQLPSNINLRLGYIVLVKIKKDKQLLQNIAKQLIGTILKGNICINVDKRQIPQQVRFVVSTFYKLAKQKFGQIKYQQLRNFFNKIIFSQLFFVQFVNILQHKNNQQNQLNMTLLALVSQKIMFTQQFHQKYKFAFLNNLITSFSQRVKQYILSYTIEQPYVENKNFSVMLSSLQTLNFFAQILIQKQGFKFDSILNVCKQKNHFIGGRNYALKNLYVGSLVYNQQNLLEPLKPTNKLQKTIIDFLLSIDTIVQKKSIKGLLQQYRCYEQDNKTNSPSVQLQSIYLQQYLKSQDLGNLIDLINQNLIKGKKQAQKIKIILQQQLNYSNNLQKFYLSLLQKQRKKISKSKLSNQIKSLMLSLSGLEYHIQNGHVCQGGSNNKTFGDVMIDICEGFVNGYEGVDGLYHLLTQRVAQKLEKGVVPDNLAQNSRIILGQQLYGMLNFSYLKSSRDEALYKKMTSHQFVNLKLLELNQYSQQQQLIVTQSLKVFERLKSPCCPEQIIKIFQDVTLVFQNIILITGSPTDITADVQIPMMLVVLIRAQIFNLDSLLNFCQKFSNQQIGALGQIMTLIKSALLLIEQLDHSKLDMTVQQYQKSILQCIVSIIQ